MSIIEINRIRKQIQESTYNEVDISDLTSLPPETVESSRLSRGLASFVLMKLTDASASSAAASVVDGFNDNGIDAIITTETSPKRLHILQAKWSDTGKSGPELGDVLKLKKGIEDLLAQRWNQFNERFQPRVAEVEEALNDPELKIEIIFASMGAPAMAPDTKGEIDRYVESLNDVSEIATFTAMSQADIHQLLIEKPRQEIDIEVSISDWGQISGSPATIYGHISGFDVAHWVTNYGEDLFSDNVRLILNNSEVNSTVLKTVTDEPHNFWYFNNGITVLCSKFSRAPLGGADRSAGVFGFNGATVVNGAQTVGTLAKALSQGKVDELNQVRVMARFISLAEADEVFGKRVTRATNTQNVIGGRDFVGLDPTQVRLQQEFMLEQLKYAVRNGEEVPPPDLGCDFNEAAIALACAHSSALATQAKREVSRLWDDTSKAPYKQLFNSGTTSLRIWRSVLLLRAIEAAIEEHRRSLAGREKSYTVHGNRTISHIVFELSDLSGIEDPAVDWSAITTTAAEAVPEVVSALISVGESDYPGGYIASMFKNSTKTADLTHQTLTQLRLS
ncbi:AIPR family protein [Gordonia alkanivorans]|uniref:AIPR family protein n=1 Tax=Gordonia alkanivorans TaxID=84096 RepID=UPI0024B6E1C3|nr:AIPR family protein [Gordonia alkanivorans]MDJ0027358.1 AIPR family protein [Gordonia alkanivorans]